MSERIELMATRDGNAISGNFYRVSAWRGSTYLGEQIFAGYTKRESLRRAREIVKNRGELFA
ncbi:hypothetical protein EBR96_10360 [bacterium]|nr:hypothetical protein [bacterium]